MSTISRLLTFLDESPTPWHAAANVAGQLAQRGFQVLDLAAPAAPLPAGSLGYVLEGGTVFAFRMGEKPPESGGFRLVAAHTDSPNLRIKPNPYVRGNGYVRLGAEPYGGLIRATWTDRDLGIAGRVTLRAPGGARTELVDLRTPLARIPNVAIHLNRGVNDDGLKLNPQTQLPAVFALDSDDKDPLRRLLGEALRVDPGEILAWDLAFVDLTRAATFGAHQEFLASGRLDNLAMCHAGLEGLLLALEREPSAATLVLALFDHEEVGSQSTTGADSRAIEGLLQHLCGHDPGAYARALRRSRLVSADMSHAVHPAHTDKAEPEHMPLLNAGPVIKQNVNWRYSTEGESAAWFLLCCERAEVKPQWYVHRSDLACGSTVGPMLASRLGIPSVDVGNPMLSMHSAREMMGTEDHPKMVSVLTEFFVG